MTKVSKSKVGKEKLEPCKHEKIAMGHRHNQPAYHFCLRCGKDLLDMLGRAPYLKEEADISYKDWLIGVVRFIWRYRLRPQVWKYYPTRSQFIKTPPKDRLSINPGNRK